MKLLWTSLVVVSLLIAASPFAHARPTDLRVAYKGSTPFGAGAFEDECGSSFVPTLGVVCVAIPKNAGTMSFVVNDASDLSVGGTYYLYDANGDAVGAGGHCGSASSTVSNVAYVVVRLELINGPIYCASQGITFGEATRGFVSFGFR